MRVLTTLREALDDPRLLGNALPGPSMAYMANNPLSHHGRDNSLTKSW